MRHRFVFSTIEKSRVSWLVDNAALRSWITSPSSNLFLINGNETHHERTSPISAYCGMLTRALCSQVPRIVLFWYCSLNVNDNIAGMLRNLIGQLLDYVEADKSLSKSIKKVWYMDFVPDDQTMLFGLFKKILKHQLRLTSVFCILDGVSFYEDNDRAQNFGNLVEDLTALVRDARKSRSIFKVLLTSPNRSEYTEAAVNAINPGSLEVLDMPSFIDTARDNLGEVDIVTSLSRANSFTSVGSHSIYEEALEYHDG